jgi:acyl-CoA oxidase
MTIQPTPPSLELPLEDQLYELLNSTRPDYAWKLRRYFNEHWEPSLTYQNEDLEGFREKTHFMVRKLLQANLLSLHELDRKPSEFYKLCEHSCWVDGSVAATLFGHFLIFGGSLVFLGTERHRHLIEPANDFSLPGCFCMTEVDHGSNLAGLGTTATYDPERREFIIHTPSWHDAKWAIALLAWDARLVTVMAQLYMPDGEDKGIHSFLVPVRDEQGRPLPGVHLSDVDQLIGLNGVGIGGAMFDHVRIPRENLLNRFADVSPEGAYTTSFESVGELFRAQISPLMIERLVPFSTAAVKIALTIAARYGKVRRQFGPRSGPERPIIEYNSHKRRLLPGVAESYAISFMLERLHLEADRTLPEPLHTPMLPLCASFKAYSYETATRVTQIARECCSVHSFRHINKIARAQLDIQGFAHAAGDNVVLYQFAGRALLEDFAGGKGPFKDHGDAELDPTNVSSTSLKHQAHFTARFTELLEYTRGEFMKLMSSGLSRAEAWNEIVTFAIEVGRAYAVRETHRQFLRVIGGCAPGPARDILTELCELYGWSTLSYQLGWYKELVDSELDLSALAVERTVLDYSQRLAPKLDLLVDSFGIPEVLLPSQDLMGDLPEKFSSSSPSFRLS